MHRRLLVLILPFALASFGCPEESSSTSGADTAGDTGADGGTDAADGTGTEGASGGPDIGEGVAWPDKTPEQKGAYMQLEVVPAISELWAQSPQPGEEINCATCHGPGVAEGEFEAHLPDADWLQFMGEQLTPAMTELLDAEPFDPATNEGFGCFACHTVAG